MQSTNLPPSFVGELYHVPTVHVCHNIIPVGIQLFWRGAPSRDPFFFFRTTLYVATIRAGGYAKTSIQRPATAMSAHNKMHASTGG